jgi:hypothetical protein
VERDYVKSYEPRISVYFDRHKGYRAAFLSLSIQQRRRAVLMLKETAHEG